jgi:hypothetical protein
MSERRLHRKQVTRVHR